MDEQMGLISFQKGGEEDVCVSEDEEYEGGFVSCTSRSGKYWKLDEDSDMGNV